MGSDKDSLFKRGLGNYFQEAKKVRVQDDGDYEARLDILVDELISPERFKDKKFFASGGLKSISIVEDQFSSCELAKAVLKSDNLDSRQSYDFLNEARLTAKLEHQNIVPIHEINLDDEGKPFFVMKLIKGKNLGEILDNELELDKWTQRELIDVFVKVCDTISYAHSQDVLHLDLKPENIVVGDYGEVMVCDWGAAKEKSEDGQWHGSTALQGTPGFIAPERLENMYNMDERVDVYSLGVILYEILTGRKPFESNELDELVSKVKKGDFLRPSQIADNVSHSLESVVLKAMATNAPDRYENTQELSADIRSWMKGFATQAEEASFFTQLSFFIKRNKLPVSLISGALIVLAAVVTVSIIELREREQRALEAKNKAESEKQLRIQLRQRAAVHFYDNAVQSEKIHDYNKAMYYSKMVVDFTPENQEAHLLLGKLLLGRAQYEAAISEFERVQTREAKKYLSLTHAFANRRNDEQLLGLIIDLGALPGGRRIVSAFCVHNKSLIRKIGVKEIIETVIGEFADGSWVYDQESKSLKISDPKFNFLYPLLALDLDSLDLTGTAISYIYPLSHIELKELNLSHTKVADLNPLKNTEIQKLDISYTYVTGLNLLQGTAIQKLNIAGIKIHFDIHLLKLKELKRLTISRATVSSHVERKLKEKGVQLIYVD